VSVSIIRIHYKLEKEEKRRIKSGEKKDYEGRDREVGRGCEECGEKSSEEYRVKPRN